MKKITVKLFSAIFAIAVAMGVGLSLPQQEVSAEYFVEGGRVCFSFDEAEQQSAFTFFTEFDKSPWLMDGKLHFWSLAEQKVILNDYVYENVEISVDLSTINECGKIDAGIYVQATNPADRLDGISAWCVNVEHPAGQKTFNLRLHRFNHGYMGAFAETIGIPYYSDEINLRVVVKDGMLSAFLNGSKKPAMQYYIGKAKGQIGLRSFYSPDFADNFTVTADVHQPDASELEELIAVAEQRLEDDVCCADELEAALSEANSASTQSEIDQAVKTLKNAIEQSVKRYTLEQLQELIAQSEQYKNENGKVYTANSWGSLVAVREICLSLDANSSEHDVSYWYGRLQAKMAALIAYAEVA